LSSEIFRRPISEVFRTGKQIPSADLPELLTPDEVARLTRQHISTVYRAIEAKKYPAVRVGRVGVRIPRDSFLTTLTEEKN
jgi:excisionase family DNA binding protein